jgi:hypothetical protein
MTLQGVSSARPVAHCNSPRRLPDHGAAWGEILAPQLRRNPAGAAGPAAQCAQGFATERFLLFVLIIDAAGARSGEHVHWNTQEHTRQRC